jgi:prolyl-tRNA editing enzyme YbaK/EbsC (Cys-tRNA(Pro) deacylase)
MSAREESLSNSAKKVQQALDTFGLDFLVQELPASTRSAIDAASAIGCQVGQIAKSLIFRFKDGGKPLLVIASGANRVNASLVGAHLGAAIEIADADYVRQATGYAIGGVPPVGHRVPLRTIIDQALLEYEEIWAAAGTPHAVFRLTPDSLIRITSGDVIRVN